MSRSGPASPPSGRTPVVPGPESVAAVAASEPLPGEVPESRVDPPPEEEEEEEALASAPGVAAGAVVLEQAVERRRGMKEETREKRSMGVSVLDSPARAR
jgi:hypothetical protein